MDEREEIKNRIDIVDLIQGYFPLKKSGRNYKACCPFHSEKTPSFMVSAERQNWHCFGSCAEGGDIFSFVMKMEGLDFYSALKMLADRAGVKLKKTANKDYSAEKDKKDKYFEINEIAAKYYEKILFESEGKVALNYLKKRDINEKTIKEFRLGYAPKKSTLLTDLQKISFTDAELLGSGIAKKPFDAAQGSRDGKLLEYFWKRIIFPIADPAGSIVGFTARTLEDNVQPKYLNTPDTEIYHKSKVLYGMDKAKTAIRKLDHAIIVEGNMDVIASHQAGITNVIAASGTAFTETQLGIIKRFTKNIKLSFDVDFAGSEATKRAIEMAMNESFNVKVIEIPDGKDPADLVKKDKNLWIASCKNAKYVIDYVFDKAFEKNNPKEILGKKAIVAALLGVIKKIPEEIEREHYIKDLSKKLDVEADALRNALNKVKNREEVKKEKDTKKLNIYELEERLLGLLLRFPEYRNFFFRNIKKEAFTDPMYIEIYELIKEGNDKKIKKHEKAGLLEFKIEEEFADFDHEKIGEEIFFLTKRLKKVFIKNKGFEVREKLKEAEKNKDTVSVAKWLKALNEILKEEGEI